MPSPHEILERLKTVKYPGFDRDIVSFGLVKDIEVGSAGVTVMLGPVSSKPEIARAVANAITQAVAAMEDVPAVKVDMEAAKPPPPSPAEVMAERQGVPGVRYTLAVASGKGGVGKSSVAVNLALALAAQGHRVGLMDADVYGPSVAMMLGTEASEVRVTPQRRIVPLTRFGIRYVSMALFIGDDKAVIWRGPMVTKLENEFLFNVEWGDLDFLVLDLPPGTGDAQLTITQRVALAGGIIVTTPQEVALMDVRRGVEMFGQVQTPVLGIVENMSYYVCRKCGRRHDIFGHGGGARIAAELGVPLLGELPIVPELRAGADNARPLVASNPSHSASRIFGTIAENVASRLMASSAADITPPDA